MCELPQFSIGNWKSFFFFFLTGSPKVQSISFHLRWRLRKDIHCFLFFWYSWQMPCVTAGDLVGSHEAHMIAAFWVTYKPTSPFLLSWDSNLQELSHLASCLFRKEQWGMSGRNREDWSVLRSIFLSVAYSSFQSLSVGLLRVTNTHYCLILSVFFSPPYTVVKSFY